MLTRNEDMLKGAGERRREGEGVVRQEEVVEPARCCGSGANGSELTCLLLAPAASPRSPWRRRAPRTYNAPTHSPRTSDQPLSHPSPLVMACAPHTCVRQLTSAPVKPTPSAPPRCTVEQTQWRGVQPTQPPRQVWLSLLHSTPSTCCLTQPFHKLLPRTAHARLAA